MADKPVQAKAEEHHPIEVASGVALTVQLIPASIKVYYLTEERLEIVASLNLTNAVYLAFLGICVGLLAAFWITLKTTTLPDPTDYAIFISLVVAAAIGVLLCGILFGIGFARSLAAIKAIKRTEVVKPISQ